MSNLEKVVSLMQSVDWEAEDTPEICSQGAVDKAIEWLNGGMDGIEFNKVAKDICSAFCWSDAPQIGDFWRRLNSILESKFGTWYLEEEKKEQIARPEPANFKAAAMMRAMTKELAEKCDCLRGDILTAAKWLEDNPEGDHRKASYDSASDIDGLIIWRNTPQKWDFWNKVHYTLKDICGMNYLEKVDVLGFDDKTARHVAKALGIDLSAPITITAMSPPESHTEPEYCPICNIAGRHSATCPRG